MVGDIVSPVAHHACRPSTSSGLEILVGFSADKTSRVMVHGSLPLAIAPQRFPAGRLVFSACRAEEYGFATVDSVRGSGAAAPGKCRRYSVPDWPPTRRRSAPILPQRGPCGCAASPARVFASPARGIRSRALLRDRERFLARGSVPVIQRSTEKTRRGVEGRDERKGEQPTAQRKTACCNSSSCSNRRMGSSACATSVSSCCFCAGNTPDCARR